jgi:predicted metal-dependent HD superfamily phosphohydrolase
MLNKNNINGLELKSQWQSLLYSVQPCQLENRRLINRCLFELVNAYSSETRFHHGLAHIKLMLEAIAPWENQANNYPAIQLAVWFHDVIYNPKAKDNEEKSADYAAKVLNRLKISPSTIEAVTQMILNTKHHQAEPEDIDSQILLDADLAILGSDESSYRFYAKGIRREYGWLSNEDYRLGRLNVLKKFLQRPRIYFTEPMFQQYEANARKNMLAEIEALCSPDSYLDLHQRKSLVA